MRKITKAMLPVLPLALVLVGCGSDSKVSVPPKGDQSYLTYEVGTSPRFDPAASDLPFNNDIIFLTPAGSQGASFDGTADVGNPGGNPVLEGLNRLDGFSTSAPFDLLIEGSLDPDSVMAGVNVFLVELSSNGDALDPANIDMQNPVAGLAPIEVKVLSLDSGTDNAIRIMPTAPLAPKTKYLVFLSNGLSPILDAQGEPITRTWIYNALTSPAFTPSGALGSVKQLVNGWQALASAFLQVASGGNLDASAAADSVTLAYTFTTTDPEAPLLAMGAPRAALVQAQLGFGIDAPEAISNAATLEAMGLLSTPSARPLGIAASTAIDLNVLTGGALPAGVGRLYTGYIKLPYYLDVPSEPGDTSYTSRAWTADQQLGQILSGSLPAGAPSLPPADVDGAFNVTYRYPFAHQRHEESVPLQVTLPEADHVPANPAFGGADCEAVRPDGYPVVIYVHGIRSDRASVAALAHSLADNCVATVAIDLPVHGVSAAGGFADLNVESSTAFDFGVLYGEDNAPRERFFNDAGGSGAQFINLMTLANTRDNLRQSVMDLLNLNASLDDIDTELQSEGLIGLDSGSVQVIGVSLGGIVGTVFATVNELAIQADTSVPGFSSNLNPIRGLVASAAGSQLTQILINSDTFAPVINGGLGAAGVLPNTANYERFIYTAQSMVDSGDPVNFAERLAGLGVPVLLQQIVGGGDATGLGDAKVYIPDAVVPNVAVVTEAPLAGTTPLAALLGASAAAPGAVDVSEGNAVVNLTIGHHASLLRPNESDDEAPTNGEMLATAELQTQAVSFVLSFGQQTGVGSAGSGAAAPFIDTNVPEL
ncbi:MAG: hypothetical protein LAT61_04320 [Alcanivorax sp.]|nr:hypothetical protein [Alcanivorax sp.]